MNTTHDLTRRNFSVATLSAGAAAGLKQVTAAVPERQAFVLPPLPYAEDALAPTVSAQTVSFHYGKHHRGYVDTLNKLSAGTDYAGLPLERIIADVRTKPENAALFNNAAQVWNHTFYWQGLAPEHEGGAPSKALLTAIQRDFGSVESLRRALADAAMKQFGSGWAWLVVDNGRLTVLKTSNAETMAARPGLVPIFTLDVWEHAYYLDWQNRRADYTAALLEKNINWKSLSERFMRAE